MLAYTSDLDQPITFPIKAILARRSWDNLIALLDASRAHTITIWSGSDLVDPDDLVYLRQNSEIDRVYYDLPDWMMALFLDRLNMTDTEIGTDTGVHYVGDRNVGVSTLIGGLGGSLLLFLLVMLPVCK